MQQLDLTSKHELMALMLEALLPLSVSPVSRFAAAAAACAVDSGHFYGGVNIEFEGVGLNNSVHAEQCLVLNMTMRREGAIEHVATAPAPCGHCRQFFRETYRSETMHTTVFDKQQTTEAGDDDRHHHAAVATYRVHKRGSQSLLELLPLSFSPADLGCQRVLLQHYQEQPRFRIASHESDATHVDQEMLALGLAALQLAYAPHTRCYSSAVVRLAGSSSDSAPRYFSGVYLENAAYNPSLPPFQGAVASMVVAGLGASSLHDIEQVLLLEQHGAQVSQHQATVAALHAIAPTASVHVVAIVPIDGSS